MTETDRTEATSTPAEQGPVSLRSQLLASLRTRTALRQAIILTEILAPPVALRPTRSPGSTPARLPGPRATP